MEFSEGFIKAFKFTMQFEVGPKFNFDDPDIQAGKCSTKSEKTKTGYACIDDDPGGETKFGIAKNANVDLDIKALTLQQAMQIYYDRYWLPIKGEELSEIVAIVVFDAAVNHGISLGAKFLQRAVGVDDDGAIGKITINATKQFKSTEICDKIIKSREDLFNSIVKRKPSQAIFLKGWLNRLASIRAFIASIK